MKFVEPPKVRQRFSKRKFVSLVDDVKSVQDGDSVQRIMFFRSSEDDAIRKELKASDFSIQSLIDSGQIANLQEVGTLHASRLELDDVIARGLDSISNYIKSVDNNG